MKLHGGPNLARGPEFDTHAINLPGQKYPVTVQKDEEFNGGFLRPEEIDSFKTQSKLSV